MLAEKYILFYWDAENKSVVPIVGGLPTFTRNGQGYAKSMEVFSRLLDVDTPRFQPDGLLLELSQDNELGAPFEMDGTSPWVLTSQITATARTSLYKGESAFELEVTGATADRNIQQSIGAMATQVAFYGDIENVDSVSTEVNLFDVTAGSIVLQVTFTWATEVVAVTDETVGSGGIAGAIKLDDIGPNGGRLFRVWGVTTPDTPSNTGRFELEPSADDELVKVIAHASAAFKDEIFTSPAVGVRATEQLEWNQTFLPIVLEPTGSPNIRPDPVSGMAVYCRWISGLAEDDGGLTTPRVWAILEDSSPALSVFYNGATITGAYDNSTATSLAAVTANPVAGDLIESTLTLHSDGAVDHSIRINGGSILSASDTGPTGGLGDAWDGTVMALNAQGDGTSKGAGTYQQLKFVNIHATETGTSRGATGGGGLTDSKEEFMDEMKLFHLHQGGTRLSQLRILNQVVNGTFDTNLDGWTISGSPGFIAWDARGHILFHQTSVGGVQLTAEQPVYLVSGKKYVISMVKVIDQGLDLLSYLLVDLNPGQQAPETASIVWVRTGPVSGTDELEGETVRAAFTVSTSGTYHLKIIDVSEAAGAQDFLFDDVRLFEVS